MSDDKRMEERRKAAAEIETGRMLWRMHEETIQRLREMREGHHD